MKRLQLISIAALLTAASCVTIDIPAPPYSDAGVDAYPGTGGVVPGTGGDVGTGGDGVGGDGVGGSGTGGEGTGGAGTGGVGVGGNGTGGLGVGGAGAGGTVIGTGGAGTGGSGTGGAIVGTGGAPGFGGAGGAVARSIVGINVDPPLFYSGSRWFADVARSVGGNTKADTWSDAPPIDANGWPTAIPASGSTKTILTNVDGASPSDTFVLTWTGTLGTMFVDSTDGLTVTFDGDHRRVFTHHGSELRIVIFGAAGSAVDIKNVQIVPVELEAYVAGGGVLAPQFIELMRPFRTIRLSGAEHVWPVSKNSRWADRVLPTDLAQGTQLGPSFEYMIDLANATASDLWVNIPPRADDDYVVHLFDLIAARLSPALLCEVELSNEIWNGDPGNPAGDFVFEAAAGHAAGMDSPDGSDFSAILGWQAIRSSQVMTIARARFALTATHPQLRLIVASQFTFEARQTHTLEELLPDGTFLWQQADALAIAPYFCSFSFRAGGGDQTYAAGWDADRLLDHCAGIDGGDLHGGVITDAIHHVQLAAAIAQSHGLALWAYEAGSALVPGNTSGPWFDLVAAANSSPRMGALYRQMLDAWVAAGGTNYNYVNYAFPNAFDGDWGLVEREGQTAGSERLQAVLDWIAANPS